MRILFTIFLLYLTTHTTLSFTLKGVVNENSVVGGFYARKEPNGKYVGFSVDLLDAIARKVGFNYSLYDSPDAISLYNVETKQMIGAIGEVNGSRADLALGNIDDFKVHHKFVDFTIPIIQYEQMSALVSRSKWKNLCTIEDLLVQAENNQTNITLIGDFWYYDYISYRSDQSTVSRLNALYDTYFDLQLNATVSLDLIKKEPELSFIVKSNVAQYLAELDCGVKVLVDGESLYPSNIVIALQRGSPHLAAFNAAIHELHDDGTVQRLKKLYWVKGNCANRIDHCD